MIFVALGLALAFMGNGFTASGGMATTAALFHDLNHSLFRTCCSSGPARC